VRGFAPLSTSSELHAASKNRGWEHTGKNTDVSLIDEGNWEDCKKNLKSMPDSYKIVKPRHGFQHKVYSSRYPDAIVADLHRNQVKQKHIVQAKSNATHLLIPVNQVHSSDKKHETLLHLKNTLETTIKEDVNWYYTSSGIKSSIVPPTQLESFTRAIGVGNGNPVENSYNGYRKARPVQR
jgi:hypothetical protein